MPEYSIRGTKIPNLIPENKIKYRCQSWDNSMEDACFNEHGVKSGLISFGHKTHDGVVYILAEKPDYTGDNLYMLRLSDLLNLDEKVNQQI